MIEKHASYIMSTPNVIKTLSSLHETIDARLGAFKRLLKLSGRLDLVLSQMSVLESNQKKASSADAAGPGVARATFVDDGLD